MIKHKIRLLTIIPFFCFLSSHGQVLNKSINLPNDTFKNIYTIPLYSDSNRSLFIIYIKEKVVLHYHAKHTETIHVLKGKAMLTLGDTTYKINKNDIIIIPSGTAHSVVVLGNKPLIVLSDQAPIFDGSDRIFIE